MVFWNQNNNSSCSVCASNPLLIVLLIVIPPVMYYIYCLLYKKRDEIVEEFKQFDGFKFSHKTEKEPENEILDRSKNSHFDLYGSTGSGETSISQNII